MAEIRVFSNIVLNSNSIFYTEVFDQTNKERIRNLATSSEDGLAEMGSYDKLFLITNYNPKGYTPEEIVQNTGKSECVPRNQIIDLQ